MALDTRTTRLAHTIAALIVLMVSSLGSALALAAHDVDASTFARQVRSLVADDVAGSSETAEGIRRPLRELYESAGMRPLWTARGQPTRRADEVIGFLAGVERNGLRPPDYDIDALRRRAAMLTGPDADTAALDDGSNREPPDAPESSGWRQYSESLKFCTEIPPTTAARRGALRVSRTPNPAPAGQTVRTGGRILVG